MNPEGSQKTVLICVVGLTPQVVTETLYALLTASDDERMVPDEVVIVTTLSGQAAVEASLLDSATEPGQVSRLLADYGFSPTSIRMDRDSVHVIRDDSGRHLDDLIDDRDNAAAADTITRTIRDYTARHDTRVMVSIAGGRKTMGYYAGHALSLHGRADDRLYHVLVNPPFESRRDFYYPPPEPQTLTLDNGATVSTSEAVVHLARIPFVALRELLPANDLENAASFQDAVALAQQSLDRPSLHIDLTRRTVWLHGRPVGFSEKLFIWLTWMAWRLQTGRGPVAFDEAGARELLGIVEWLEGAGESKPREGVLTAMEGFRTEKVPNYFSVTRTQLNRHIKKKSGLSPRVAEQYLVHKHGIRNHLRYGLDLPVEAVRIEGEA